VLGRQVFQVEIERGLGCMHLFLRGETLVVYIVEQNIGRAHLRLVSFEPRTSRSHEFGVGTDFVPEGCNRGRLLSVQIVNLVVLGQELNVSVHIWLGLVEKVMLDTFEDSAGRHRALRGEVV